MPDPDRFFDLKAPGSQEWWYFDAIGDDGRDALVLIWYAALPFDPAYGVAALRHRRDPARYPPPEPLDHCAIGLSWYRDGKTIAYALNSYRRNAFRHEAEPFAVEVAGCRVSREGGRYHLAIDTPAVDGTSRIRADLEFRPADGSSPFEQDLGTVASPHAWVLAAADNRVAGRVEVEGPGPRSLEFRGRGYHDHNAGSEEISLAFARWSWGRVHHGPRTEIYYDAEPRQGESHALWITCEDGRPTTVRREPARRHNAWRRNVFGVRYDVELTLDSGLERRHRHLVDGGPFYLRWLSEFEAGGEVTLGFAETLDTRNLHKPWFNWMIPYRLKRPSSGKSGTAPSPRDVPLRLT